MLAASVTLAPAQRLDLTPPPTLGPGSSPELAKLATRLRIEADALRGETATPQNELSAAVRVLAAALLERADALGPPGSLHGIVGMGLEASRGELDAELTAHPRLDDLHRLVLAQRVRTLATNLPNDPEALARRLRDTLAPSLELMGVEPVGKREPPIAARLDAWREAGLIDDALVESLREFDETLGDAARWAAYAPWVDRTRRVVREAGDAIMAAIAVEDGTVDALGEPAAIALGRLARPAASAPARRAALTRLARLRERAVLVAAVDGELRTSLVAMLGNEQIEERELDDRVEAITRLIAARDAELPGGGTLPRMLRPAHAVLTAERRRIVGHLERDLVALASDEDEDWRRRVAFGVAIGFVNARLRALDNAGRLLTDPDRPSDIRSARQHDARRILDAARAVERARDRNTEDSALERLAGVVSDVVVQEPKGGEEALVRAIAEGSQQVPDIAPEDAAQLVPLLDNPERRPSALWFARIIESFARLQDRRATGRFGALSGHLEHTERWSAIVVRRRVSLFGGELAQWDETVESKSSVLQSLAGVEMPGHTREDVLAWCATLVVPLDRNGHTRWSDTIELLRYAAELGLTTLEDPVKLTHCRDVAIDVLSKDFSWFVMTAGEGFGNFYRE